LLEFFRGMRPAEMKAYLSVNPCQGITSGPCAGLGAHPLYTLCSDANFSPLNASATLDFPDPVATLPTESRLDPKFLNRSYRVQILDTKTLVPVAGACGKKATEIVPNREQAYFVTVEVAWGE